MKAKYFFNNKDITKSFFLKIEHIVNIISVKLDIDFKAAYKYFLSSKTYISMQDTENWLWTESAEFIADDFFRENQLIFHCE